MVQLVKARLQTWFLEFTCWNERTNSLKLFPDLHMCQSMYMNTHRTSKHTLKCSVLEELCFMYFPNFLPNTCIIFTIEEKVLQGWGDRSGIVELGLWEQMDTILRTGCRAKLITKSRPSAPDRITTTTGQAWGIRDLYQNVNSLQAKLSLYK